MEKKYWEYPKYDMGQDITDENIEILKRLVEEHGGANATWNVSNFIHESKAKSLAKRLPEYNVSIDYKTRKCFVQKKS